MARLLWALWLGSSRKRQRNNKGSTTASFRNTVIQKASKKRYLGNWSKSTSPQYRKTARKKLSGYTPIRNIDNEPLNGKYTVSTLGRGRTKGRVIGRVKSKWSRARCSGSDFTSDIRRSKDLLAPYVIYRHIDLRSYYTNK